MSGRNGLRVRGDITTGWEGSGGYMEAKVQKLDQQFQRDSESRSQLSTIFRGVAILVDGYTDPNSDELKLIMSKHGGKFHMYYSRAKTTHVIASNLPHAKRKDLRPNQKVVKPQWIVDSLKAKQLLPVDSYLVVPLENGSQNRISNLIGKRKTTDSDATVLSPVDVESTASKEVVKGQKANNTVMSKPGPVSHSSSTICPTTDSNFLSEFYSHSRLHFLSTWKMELTEYVRSLQSEDSLKELPLSGYQSLMEIAKAEGFKAKVGCERVVLHIDMDCFFVSVGLISRPELRGLPVAVTHSSGSAHTRERSGTDLGYEKTFYENKFQKKSNHPGSIHDECGEDETKQQKRNSISGSSTSEVASCSYEARVAGVKNGMFFGTAKRLCPDLRVIPYDFEAYREASQQLYSTLASYTRHLEAVSCDEALVDITTLVSDTGLSPLCVASQIRQSVKQATKCNASTGVGPNIALARMATRHAKPDGEYEVTMQGAKKFMEPSSVKDLPGVGRSTASRLQELGIANCGNLQKFDIEKLKEEFGNKTGKKLFDMSHGIDIREVKNEKERKSVSADVNYGIRLSNEEEAKTFLKNLSEEVTNRLKSARMRGRRVTLKIMVRRPDAPIESAKYGGHGICDSMSKSQMINCDKIIGPLSDEDMMMIFDASWSMLKALKTNVTDLRGIGIQVTQLQPVNLPSTSAQSSSAAFLKKFVTKKSSNPTEVTEPGDSGSQISTTIQNQTVTSITTTSTEDHQQYDDTVNLSFLEALPPDLRKEVQENFTQQKKALQNDFNRDKELAAILQQIPDHTEEASSSANVPNLLFCGQGKLSRGVKPGKQNVTGRGQRKRKRGNAQTRTTHKRKGSPLSKSAMRTASIGTSPNKLITDMFPVTYSPRKTPGKNTPSKAISPARALIQRNTSSMNSVKRKLIPIIEEVPIEITDSEEETVTDCLEEADEPPTVPQKETVPSIGGAVTIKELRQVLSEWTEAYKDNGPLECDVSDFTSFLTRTAVDLRDLEKVDLVVKSFRRKLRTILSSHAKFRLREIRQGSIAWPDVYDLVCEELQKAVGEKYRGAKLVLPSLGLC